MSGKAGELVPSNRSLIFPAAHPRPAPPTWVARVPSERGLEAMKNCKDIVEKIKAESKAERGKKFTRTLAGVSGTWFIWKFVDVAESGKKKG